MRGRGAKAGQGTAEYVVLLGLVAILLVAAIGRFARGLGDAFQSASGMLEERVEAPLARAAAGEDPRAADLRVKALGGPRAGDAR